MLRIDNEVFKRIIESMLLRLNWLFTIFIYLSINGQIFAAPLHLCSEMALSSNTLSTSQKTVNIHEHEKKSTHLEIGEEPSMIHDMHESKEMDNCHCIDCDCIQTITGQANTSIIQQNSLTDFFPTLTKVLVKLNQEFISQSHTNPFRPPIVI